MKPLQGILVVALERAVAAPFCTCRLADAGARVIKVERPEGDFTRNYDDVAQGLSGHFVWLNRGKESVVLDLSAESKAPWDYFKLMATITAEQAFRPLAEGNCPLVKN
jgi:itaconate CoA-transferase